MTSPGRLQDRFFWERVNDQYAIYDRTRGAGCFGENFVATAIDGVVAETMCGLMNTPAAVSDGRPEGWTEAKALAFCVGQTSDAEYFARLFCEGDWSGVARVWPEFQAFVEEGAK